MSAGAWGVEDGREDVILLNFKISVRGDHWAALLAQAEDRDLEPAELLADVIEAVLRDDLFAAVLDDGK